MTQMFETKLNAIPWRRWSMKLICSKRRPLPRLTHCRKSSQLKRSRRVSGNERFHRDVDESVGLVLAGGSASATSFDACCNFYHGAELGSGVIGVMLLDKGRDDGEKPMTEMTTAARTSLRK